MVNKEVIDLRYVEQLVDSEQLTALGYCVVYALRNLLDGRRDLRRVADELEAAIDRGTLAALCGDRSGVPGLARPPGQEILACLNRCRGLRIQ